MMSQDQNQGGIEFYRRSDYREEYSNFAQATWNTGDFLLVFSRIVYPAVESTIQVEQHTAIVISPQQAKMLLATLQNTVNGYERTYGEIRVVPQEKQQLEPGAQPRLQ
jgi:Protein of unknown function (DUF3467)